MDPVITILFAYRDRDINRLRYLFQSLQAQNHQNFKVIFVDYGSEEDKALSVKELVKSYSFASYYYVGHPGLLWNKSKAFNYGIKKSVTPFILTADVDLIFHPESSRIMGEHIQKEIFYLFNWGYLDKEKSGRLSLSMDFENLQPERFGSINGMVLSSKEALEKVHGFDEFFHFYGAEDEDLFARLLAAGYGEKKIEGIYVFHIWHKSFSIAENSKLTLLPRIKNIMRINHCHFLRNKEKGVVIPKYQNNWGVVVLPESEFELDTDANVFYINNTAAQVEHFLNEELQWLHGDVVKVEFFIDPFYHTFKHWIKKFIGKHTQPYLSLKEVNDLILKKILFNYRNFNYYFSVSKDLKKIYFCIDLRNK